MVHKPPYSTISRFTAHTSHCLFTFIICCIIKTEATLMKAVAFSMQKVDVTSFIFNHRKHAGESWNNRTQSRSNGKGLYNIIVDLVCKPTKQILRKRGKKCHKGAKDTRKQTVTI